MTASFTVARSVGDAVGALAEGARPVAGGTDLVVGARQGKAPLPERIVGIDRIDRLQGITGDDGSVRLGALATHEAIAADPLIRARLTALADASAIVGSHATRANGTIGGNVMNASPAMETGGPLLCHGAVVMLEGAHGTREVELADLLVGPGRTSASTDELLTGIEIPLPAEGAGGAYVRLEYRRQMEIAVVGVTALVTLSGGRVADARVAITALAPTIRRVPDAEGALAGTGGADEAIARAAAAVAEAARPISDVRASERYRRAMADVIARRAIRAALRRARGEVVPVPASTATYGGLA